MVVTLSAELALESARRKGDFTISSTLYSKGWSDVDASAAKKILKHPRGLIQKTHADFTSGRFPKA